MRLGVLDVGSNTVHLLIVDAHPGAPPLPAHSRKTELRLAEHLRSDGSLSQAAIDSLIEVVRDSVRDIEDFGATDMLTVVTSALRDASNTATVLSQVAKATGVHLTILSGEDEARLTFLAARRWYGWSSGRLLVLDIGGGSLEVAVGSEEAPTVAFSLPLGAARLTRDYLHHDPPTAEEVRALRRVVRVAIGEVVGTVTRAGTPDRVVATSKTFRSLARVGGARPAGDGPRITRQLRRADLPAIVDTVIRLGADQRCDLPGVSPARSAQLAAGALIAQAALDLLGVSEVDICPWALREGVILRHLDHLVPDWAATPIGPSLPTVVG